MGSVKHFYRLAVCAALIALTAAETRAAETKSAATEKNISNFPNAAALQRLARRAITKIRDRNNLLPVDKSKVKNITIVCTTYGEVFFKPDRLATQNLFKQYK